jgi:3-phosphoshikimate 1-carboxyvinyltransferase
MTATITPVLARTPDPSPIVFSLPPDKSILHRILFIGSLTQSSIHIPLDSALAISHDIVATVLALESLGVPVELFDEHIELQGVGRHGYRMPTHVINCANSGTTARLLMGLLAGQPFNSALTGDASLSVRPMGRVAELLSHLGASIVTAPEGTLPVMIIGSPLHGANVELVVASAQMKSAVLLAGLLADGATTIREPSQSRDHTERMLEAFGFGIELNGDITVDPTRAPDVEDEFEYVVPGDLSSAAFLIVASILLRRRITLDGVGLNPTRSRFLDVLTLMGVELEAANVVEIFGEPRGDLTVYGDRAKHLVPFELNAEDIPLLIDELPALSVLAIFAEGESTIHGAQELRLKESDRLRLTTEQLRAFGVEVMEYDDGLSIHGIPGRELHTTSIEHGGDHRLAMAFSIASLFCGEEVQVIDAEVAAVSYPEFYTHLRKLCGPEHVEVHAL